MDILGYLFLITALLSLISGLTKGLAKTLLDIVSIVGSIAVAILLTPVVCKIPTIQALIEDAPIIIAGQQIYILRTIIVGFALFVLALVLILAIKGIINAILKRTKLLKFVDRLLGAVVGLALTWAIFGAAVGIANVGSDWIVELQNQLVESNIPLDLSTFVQDTFQQISSSQILQAIYSSFNPIGDLICTLLA